MLLEDEFGSINLIIPPPVYDVCRVAANQPPCWATGALERREGVTNILVDEIGRLDRPDLARRARYARSSPR